MKKLVVYAVWGWYADDKAEGIAPTILSAHRTIEGANRWAELHRLTDWWVYTYTVEE